MQAINPCLWFDGVAEEAAEFYVSVLSGRPAGASRGPSKILDVSRYTDAGPGPVGTVVAVSFLLEGQQFTGLNGGPQFPFTEAVSFVVNCETQADVDYLWDALSAGGQEVQCGWLKDRFGLSWQIVPTVLFELIADPDPAKATRTTEAMLKMVKLDIEALTRAHEGS